MICFPVVRNLRIRVSCFFQNSLLHLFQILLHRAPLGKSIPARSALKLCPVNEYTFVIRFALLFSGTRHTGKTDPPLLQHILRCKTVKTWRDPALSHFPKAT